MYRRNKKSLKGEATEDKILVERMFESTERLEWKVEKRDEELITEFSSSTEVEEQVPNNYMTIRTETADVLPECVIRKILCFLSFKEAAKLSILSKTWLRAWLTHPNLDVIVDYNGNNLDIVDNIMKRYRDRIIPIEKFELSYFDSSSQGFPLIDKWFDIALQNGVKDIAFNVPKYSSYRLPIFKILATKSLRELVVWGCHLKRASLSTGVVNCNSLRLLSLSYVTLSEKMLQTLLNICPLIVSFVCDYCDGLEKIELVNLQNIKSISIWKGRKQRVKIQAPTLEHLSYFSVSRESSMLDMLDVPNLVSLEYKGDQIPETFVDANFQWSCYPKRLILESTSKTIASFMDRLMNMKSLSHSSPDESKSFNSQLKEVKVYTLDSSWQLVEFRSFVQNIEFGRLEEAAEGYLMDIISSNAVMASK
ncbi:F-box protein At5g03100-like [Solanum lycopersicum]|uniref:F-box protein At5g03100-like n=1 Tax=Solanum lycopersicum TaxID=4081 RepID=UPI000532D6FD|nr:putative FBD-associated F-box protein At5g56690 [Solanum lycopersicum]